MTADRQSTVIFVHSTAHWEAIQQQKSQLLGLTAPTEPTAPKKEKRPPADAKVKRSLVGKEGSRRRQRWTNNTFSEHPQAVLYAEDLRPPGYVYKHHDASVLLGDIVLKEQKERPVIPTVLSRHIRHDLKKAHISQGFVSSFESQLIDFIDRWLEEPENEEKAYLQWTSQNQFERYIIHTMSQYYGLCSFSKTNDQQDRITYVFHPVYVDFMTENQVPSDLDYTMATEDYFMPEKSFFDYLFHKENAV